MQKTTQF